MSPPGNRLRLLLIAEAANPEWVSVPLVGWSMSRALAKVSDAHLVTQVRNRDALLRAGLVEGRDFTAINSEHVARRLNKLSDFLRGGRGKAWTIATAMAGLAYQTFERMVWQQFGDRVRAGEYDVVHRVTPLSPTISSPIAGRIRRAGVPFVIGPLNGGVPWPSGFDKERRKEREWLSYVRGAYKLLPGYSATRRHASALLIASRDTWNQMPTRYHEKSVYVPENAIDPSRFTLRRTRRAGRPLKVIFIGRLVPYKGADMLIEAAAPLIRSGAITVEIVGDGPQLPELKELAARLNLTDGIHLAGWVAHQEVQHRLIEADLFAFPSIREFGGAVALEAMAAGVVPAVVAYGGLGELVTERTGFPIEIGTRQQIIERFRKVLTDLSEHPETIDAKSEAAYQRAHQLFTWDAKAKQVLEVYDWVLGRKPKPRFPMPMPDLTSQQ